MFVQGALQLAGAFGAGLATSLSPCVYPMIPITVGFLGSGAEGAAKKKRVVGFFLGQVAAFTALGVVAVSLGEVFGFSSEIPAVQVGVGIMLLVMAAMSGMEKLPGFLYRLNRFQGSGNSSTLGGAFLVGVSSAAVASPCTSPVIGGVLAALAQVEERGWAMFLMFAFAVGLSFLFLLLGLGFAKASSMPRAGGWMKRVHQGSALLLALGGIYSIARGFGLP